MLSKLFLSTKTLLILLFGILVGALLMLMKQAHFDEIVNAANHDSTEQKAVPSKKEPLYWVAPMDSSYRRDKPGKSPMGMDLIPVYEEAKQLADKTAIYINPDVINNLGVRTSTVSYGKLPSKITAPAVVRFDETHLQHFHARVEGWVHQLFVHSVGEPISAGQPLFTFYSPELVNAQGEFLLVLKNGAAEQIVAAEKRLLALSISQKAIEQVKQERKVLQHITYYAGQSGVVETLAIREGFYITPMMNVLTIADNQTVWLEAQVFEQQINQISLGMPVNVTLPSLPEKSYQSVINFIEPTVDAKTQTVKVRMQLNNRDFALKPEMFAEIEINTVKAEQSLLVEKSALIRTGKQDRVVLALGDGLYKSVAVQVGKISDEFAQILSGIEEDDLVVTAGQFLIDSESSKTSDFQRMSVPKNDDMTETMAEMDMPTAPAKPSIATVTGKVISVMPAHRMVTIDRDAIEKWQRPAAEVDFIVADDLDMSLFKEGQKLNFTFLVANGDFLIVHAEAIAVAKE